MRQLDSPSQTTAHLFCLLQLHATPEALRHGRSLAT